jgi:hypothetical protein
MNSGASDNGRFFNAEAQSRGDFFCFFVIGMKKIVPGLMEKRRKNSASLGLCVKNLPIPNNFL